MENIIETHLPIQVQSNVNQVREVKYPSRWHPVSFFPEVKHANNDVKFGVVEGARVKWNDLEDHILKERLKKHLTEVGELTIDFDKMFNQIYAENPDWQRSLSAIKARAGCLLPQIKQILLDQQEITNEQIVAISQKCEITIQACKAGFEAEISRVKSEMQSKLDEYQSQMQSLKRQLDELESEKTELENESNESLHRAQKAESLLLKEKERSLKRKRLQALTNRLSEDDAMLDAIDMKKLDNLSSLPQLLTPSEEPALTLEDTKTSL